MAQCPHWSHSSTWPPKAAVRQARMSWKAFFCWRDKTFPTEPESRPHKCGKCRPLPAGARSSLRLKCAAGLDHIERVQQLQRADGRAYGGVGDMQIGGGGFQMGMAEENLNGAEVHPGFQ